MRWSKQNDACQWWTHVVDLLGTCCPAEVRSLKWGRRHSKALYDWGSASKQEKRRRQREGSAQWLDPWSASCSAACCSQALADETNEGGTRGEATVAEGTVGRFVGVDAANCSCACSCLGVIG